jgi:hypothetical protein
MSVIAALLLLMMGFTVPASAQDPSPSTDVRPAVTTFWGDTGLWFVPTAEVLRNKKWSVSFYRVNIDDGQGFTPGAEATAGQSDRAAPGRGLGNLHERLAAIGGRCTITSEPGGGTRVRLEVPLA